MQGLSCVASEAMAAPSRSFLLTNPHHEFLQLPAGLFNSETLAVSAVWLVGLSSVYLCMRNRCCQQVLKLLGQTNFQGCNPCEL